MTKAQVYREVFGSNAGREVLADLARYVEQMNVAEPGSAGKLIAHVTRILNEPDRVAPPRPAPSTVGRIAHG